MNKRFGFALVISIILHFTIGFCAIRLFYPSPGTYGKIPEESQDPSLIPSPQKKDITQSIENTAPEMVFTKHTVKRGESLWIIARDYQVSIEALMDANGLEPQYILKVGDQLKIPKNNP